jgi:hypothetical protein
MTGDPEEEDDYWFRPVWETEDALEPPGTPRVRKTPPEADLHHPLLEPLARAQEAVARLETGVELASPAVAEGLRARLSYREAAGWLGYAHVWIHPHDLALRDRGLTSSYGVAFNTGRLNAAIPTTAALESFESAPSDIMVNQALQLARLWRRLAEMRTWRPLADTQTVRETLQSLGCRILPDAEIEDWMAFVDAEQGPMLIRAGRAARDWMNRPGVTDRDLGGIFLAACILSDEKSRRPLALPFWSAAEARHQRRELQVGIRWLAAFLDCVAAAAKAGLDELERLRRAEEITRSLGRTARSRLPDAANAVLRASIVTAGDLAATLDVSPQAALGLLRQLMEAGLVREATHQKSWRAFVLSMV